MTLGERLKEAREAVNLTPLRAAANAEELGTRIGVLDIARYEENIHVPGIDKLKALARVYGVTVDSLVSDNV